MKNPRSIICKFMTYVSAVLIGCASLIFFLGNPGKDLLEEGASQDVMRRRNFLVRYLSSYPSSADLFGTEDVQYTAEWTMGTYAMATYALTNIAMSEPNTAQESSRIIGTWIEFCLDEKISEFDKVAWRENPLDEKALQGDRGHIGYYGHLNLMLGCYSLLNNDGKFEQLHRKLSDAIGRRMAKYPHRHIETYPYETYPPDNTVAAASLRVADMTLGTNYDGLVDEWVQQSKKIEWQPYGLVVFQIDSETGEPLQTCRGANIAWNSFFLPLVDRDYAKIQFDRFKKNMLRRFAGFAAFKEYPKGDLFRVDCDTGPVILGMGGTATGFSVAGAKSTKDHKLLTELLRSIEIVGVSVSKGKERRYLLGPAVADAIMLAVKTACEWRPLWKSEK